MIESKPAIGQLLQMRLFDLNLLDPSSFEFNWAELSSSHLAGLGHAGGHFFKHCTETTHHSLVSILLGQLFAAYIAILIIVAFLYKKYPAKMQPLHVVKTSAFIWPLNLIILTIKIFWNYSIILFSGYLSGIHCL